MKLIKTENYPTIGRNFQINTYRNNDTLIIDTVELVDGKLKKVPVFKGIVPLHGNRTLEPDEYPEYAEQLCTVKSSIVLGVNRKLV